MTTKHDLIEYLLRLGDSALIQGQRLCELCGKAPEMEEEIALMNVGLDLIGQSRNWLEYAAELLDDGRDADQLAFRRDERAFRNLLIVEQPNGDFAVTMTKQFFYDAWHFHVLEALVDSTDERVAAIAGKAIKEAAYHLRRSSEWIVRLGDGTDESRRRVLAAIDELWRLTSDLFEVDDVEARLCEAGISHDGNKVATAWKQCVKEVFAEATLDMPVAAPYFYLDGRKGMHTEHLGILLAEMQFLQRAYPDAVW